MTHDYDLVPLQGLVLVCCFYFWVFYHVDHLLTLRQYIYVRKQVTFIIHYSNKEQQRKTAATYLMSKVFTKTTDAISRFGEHMERQLGLDGRARSKSGVMFGGPNMAYNYPIDRRNQGNNLYLSQSRNFNYGGVRRHPGNGLAASPSIGSFNHFQQPPPPPPPLPQRRPGNDRVDRPAFRPVNRSTSNYRYQLRPDGFAGGYGSLGDNMGCCPAPVNVGCAPNYYIAERRQIELIPAPPPQIIHQQVPCAVPVDRPVPVPCAVPVPMAVPCDRPVPVAVPVPVPCDRPVPYPVHVSVPSPPPPPICVPVPVPTPVPCYIPCCCPAPPPPPPPLCCPPPPCCPPPCCPPPCCPPPPPFCPPPCCAQRPAGMEQQLTNTLRWFNGVPSMGNNPYGALGNNSFVN